MIDPDLLAKMKRILQAPETKEQIRENILKETEKEKEQISKVIASYFPDHSKHGLKGKGGKWFGGEDSFIEDMKHFDAMFVSMRVKCGCGEILSITREMMLAC